AKLGVFRVFTDFLLFVTSSFLDVFDCAKPLVDKVNELSANGISLVSVAKKTDSCLVASTIPLIRWLCLKWIMLTLIATLLLSLLVKLLRWQVDSPITVLPMHLQPIMLTAGDDGGLWTIQGEFRWLSNKNW
uniref:Uncharacterized protein n=1 Tax=Echinococcus canadensis TaxID=519352 RepID=A0A915EXG2_9CEST